MYRAAAAVLILFAAVAAVPGAAPVQLSYVYSDSMEPTIPEDAGFLLVPAGEVRAGDIVVFDVADKPVTAHRVVDRTERGFVTKGDNNDVTDQATGTPYVQRSDIRGQVLTVGGGPLVVPGLGVVVSTVRDNRLVVVAGVVALLLLSGRASVRSRERSVSTVRDALGLLLVGGVLALVFMSLIGASVPTLTFVAVPPDAADDGDIAVGERTNTTVVVRNAPPQSVVTYGISAQGATVTGREWDGSQLNVSLSVPPRERAGSHSVRLAIHRYPASLPAGLVSWLHALHPLVAALATALATVGPLYLLGRLLMDPSVPIRTGRGPTLGGRRRR